MNRVRDIPQARAGSVKGPDPTQRQMVSRGYYGTLVLTFNGIPESLGQVRMETKFGLEERIKDLVKALNLWGPDYGITMASCEGHFPYTGSRPRHPVVSITLSIDGSWRSRIDDILDKFNSTSEAKWHMVLSTALFIQPKKAPNSEAELRAQQDSAADLAQFFFEDWRRSQLRPQMPLRDG